MHLSTHPLKLPRYLLFSLSLDRLDQPSNQPIPSLPWRQDNFIIITTLSSDHPIDSVSVYRPYHILLLLLLLLLCDFACANSVYLESHTNFPPSLPHPVGPICPASRFISNSIHPAACIVITTKPQPPNTHLNIVPCRVVPFRLHSSTCLYLALLALLAFLPACLPLHLAIHLLLRITPRQASFLFLSATLRSPTIPSPPSLPPPAKPPSTFSHRP
ncbi:hypothetical protein F5B22DRAFT_326246 [Xylaria bambusicola]|uniref:uncharacterized protein n=1 Tax=Xylaria bambusicola TaxID=326684 RepID=UPI002008B3F5|nr:uncharacterized protein F5B22DRAFT_326246 [Xylaria bambusicola]KAI0509549.1 hypothetical protein F5B22DRAFT_326246 [Xylaria bambusicola]